MGFTGTSSRRAVLAALGAIGLGGIGLGGIGLGAAVARAATAPIVVRHAGGTTEITPPVEQVVSLEWSYTEAALALGLPPLATADLDGYRAWVGIGVERIAASAAIGSRQEPSLEAIARLRPQLILASALRHRALLPPLAAIAPAVLIDDGPAGGGGSYYEAMRDGFALIATALDRAAAGAEVLARLDADLAATRARIAAAGRGGTKVALGQVLPGVPRFRLFTGNSLAVGVLDRVGLARGWSGPEEPFGFNTVGLEALAAIDGHLLLIAPPGDAGFAQIAAGRLWQRLPFVASGRLHRLDSATWVFGGPLSAARLADQAAAAFA